jgi:hypothetical protein
MEKDGRKEKRVSMGRRAGEKKEAKEREQENKKETAFL